MSRNSSGLSVLVAAALTVASCGQSPSVSGADVSKRELVYPNVRCASISSAPSPWKIEEQDAFGIKVSASVEAFDGAIDDARPLAHNKIRASVHWVQEGGASNSGDALAAQRDRFLAEGVYRWTTETRFVLPGYTSYLRAVVPSADGLESVDLLNIDASAKIRCPDDETLASASLAQFCIVDIHKSGRLLSGQRAFVPIGVFPKIPDIIESLDEVAFAFERVCSGEQKDLTTRSHGPSP